MASNPNGQMPSSNPLSNPGWRQRAAARAAQTANSTPKKGGFSPPVNVELCSKLVAWAWREDKAKDGHVYADTFVLTHMIADSTHPNYLETFKTYYKIWPQSPKAKVDPKTGKPYGDRMTGWLRGFMSPAPGLITTNPQTGETIDPTAVETNWPAILDQIVADCKGDIAYLAKPILLNTTNKNKQTGQKEPGKPTMTLANVKYVSGYTVGEGVAVVPTDTADEDEDAVPDDGSEADGEPVAVATPPARSAPRSGRQPVGATR